MSYNKNEKCNIKIIEDFMNKVFQTYLPEKDNLIQILNEVQDEYGYIPEIAKKKNIRISENTNGRNIWSDYFLFKIYIRAKRKIYYISLFRNSMLCKRFTKNIR